MAGSNNNVIKRTIGMDNTRRFFTALVIGDNHKEIMDEYSPDKKVEQYVKYKYLDAKKYLTTIKKAMSALCDDSRKSGFGKEQIDIIKGRLASLDKMSPFEYYQMLTEGMYYDDNGNALSDENPNVKYSSCHVGREFSVPFKMLSGEELYSAKKGDIDWSKMHLSNQRVYERAWELAVDDDEPNDSGEEQVKKIMSEKKNYFANFSSKEDYVTYSTAYWAYAIVDENGWKDVDSECNGNMQKWISSFYEKYVKDIPDDKTLTIYECVML